MPLSMTGMKAGLGLTMAPGGGRFKSPMLWA